jgi:threonine/homoserine/homoserine lactone efflux protein
MDLLSFVATVVLVTASGALAPGPLFFVNLSQGAEGGARSGLLLSTAHALVEFTLVMLLAAGLLAWMSEPAVKLLIGVAGGIMLIFFGAAQIHRAFKPKPSERTQVRAASHNLFLIGLAFTGLNPFFILWWLTAGAQLIIIALEFASILGVVFMYFCHVWMDYVWLTGTAYLSKAGTNVAGAKAYRFMVAFFGTILACFGFTFIVEAFTL